MAGDLISGHQYGTGLAACYSTLVVAKDNVGCWFGLCSDKDIFEILGWWKAMIGCKGMACLSCSEV